MAPLPIPSPPTSKHVALRVPSERDVDLVIDASTDPSITMISSVEANSTPDQAREFIARQQQRPAQGLGWSFTIVDAASDIPVGNMFVSGNAQHLGCADIGYWIGPSHRGSGYAGAALALVHDWAPAALDLDRLTLYIDPANMASSRTAERAGFTAENTLDMWERLGDEFRPMTVWGSRPVSDASSGNCSQLVALEQRMWLDDYRGDSDWIDHYLHADFVEHGRSGRRITRQHVVGSPVDEIEIDLPFTDLTVEQIDATTWLVSYVAVQPHRTCRRMSLWQQTPDGWRLRFHQGTLAT